MKQSNLKTLANKYCVEDLPESFRPGTSLAIVISRLELAPDFIPEATKLYLRKAKLDSLLRYACKQISFNDFSVVAKSEQVGRKLAAEAAKIEQAKRAAINSEKIRKQKIIQNLLKKYDLELSFIIAGDIPKLQDILEKTELGSRLNQDEIAWLMISRNGSYFGYYTDKVRKKYHKIEAEYFSKKFQNSNNPWDAINASSHFRKCNQATKADSVLINIDSSKLKPKKLESAFHTTYGGVKRDLENFNEAINHGNKAHLLTPNDFRPCTLLGAVSIEIGNYDEGQSWYRKAVERGATQKSVDDDLRSIFMRSEKSKRKELGTFLYNNDPERYEWVKKYIK
ncbi:MAG: hypothetical protein V2B20_19425 [Pseudomonadota bacterium]